MSGTSSQRDNILVTAKGSIADNILSSMNKASFKSKVSGQSSNFEGKMFEQLHSRFDASAEAEDSDPEL